MCSICLWSTSALAFLSFLVFFFSFFVSWVVKTKFNCLGHKRLSRTVSRLIFFSFPLCYHYFIALIAWNSYLVLLIKGLRSSNPDRFEFLVFWRNRTDDLGIISPSLRPTELVYTRLSVKCLWANLYPRANKSEQSSHGLPKLWLGLPSTR